MIMMGLSLGEFKWTSLKSHNDYPSPYKTLESQRMALNRAASKKIRFAKRYNWLLYPLRMNPEHYGMRRVIKDGAAMRRVCDVSRGC